MSRHIVLIIEGTFPWYRGGVSEWVDRYIKHAGNDTFGIIQIVLPPYFGRLPKSGIYPIRNSITDFKQIKPPDMKVAAYPGSSAYINEWLSDNYKDIEPYLRNAKIIHAANTGFAGLLGAYIKKKKFLPMVVTEHAVYWKEVEKGAVALECGLPVKQDDNDVRINTRDTFQNIARTVYKRADCTISVARSNIASQQHMGAHPVKYIPNGVDAELLCENMPPVNDKRNLVIGWVGRCANIKQPLRFLNLVEHISTKTGNISTSEVSYEMYLSRAGESELENEVVRRASNISNLTLHWNESAKKAMRHFDALCISSISEAQPLVALEAIAGKTLPFGWRCGDLDSELGIFFAQDKPVGEIADDLLNLWFQHEEWRSKVNHLFRKVKKAHLWKEIFKQYNELFDALIETSNSPIQIST